MRVLLSARRHRQAGPTLLAVGILISVAAGTQTLSADYSAARTRQVDGTPPFPVAGARTTAVANTAAPPTTTPTPGAAGPEYAGHRCDGARHDARSRPVGSCRADTDGPGTDRPGIGR